MNPAPRPFRLRAQRFVGLAVLCGTGLGLAHAQELVNGDFESGASGWTGCTYEIGASDAYGGPSEAEHVAEVDGGLTTSPDDDTRLCQVISGFVPGQQYALGFEATRRTTGSAPSTVAVILTVSDNALTETITRTGSWSMQVQVFQFTATQGTHTIEFKPDFEGTYGMVLDNITIAPAQQLPVELIAFDAAPMPHGAQLAWATGSEQGSNWFRVERSTDAAHWEEVAALPAAGYSNSPRHYTVNDADAPVGDLLYRLRMEDADGGWSHSAVRLVRLVPGTVACWPNPATHVVRIAAPPEAFDIGVVDGAGRTMRAEPRPADGIVELRVEAFAPGAYHVIDHRTGSPVGRFLKQ